MKFLHTSDWHLGAMEGNYSLKEDQQFFIDAICNIAEQEQVDAVLIAGDVYDRSVASADAISLYDAAMSRLCKQLRKQVLIIAGNHDSAERLAACGELLSMAGLHVAGMLEAKPFCVSFEDADIYLLPWISEEKVRSVYPERKNEIHNLESAYNAVTDVIRQSFDPAKKHIILSHAYITDSETSDSDRAAVIGYAANVSAKVFEGFDYAALGHIHKPQTVAPGVRYSGTPMPFSFGKEESQEKSVTIVDTADMSEKVIPVPRLHRWTTLTGTLSELLNTQVSEEVRTGYVRLQITDAYASRETMASLEVVYPKVRDFSGKSIEGDDSRIGMPMQEFEELQTDPEAIFARFCTENLNAEPDEHRMDLFRNAVKEVEEELK